MKELKAVLKLIVHCSATYEDMDIDAEWIRRVHVDENGWEDIGYHIVIKRDGSIEYGRPLDKQGAHAWPHNHDSVGVCLVGGLDETHNPFANFTYVQYKALLSVIDDFPGVEVLGHRDISAKECPCFSVQSLLNNPK